MKLQRNIISQMELEKVMTQYGMESVVHFLRERRTAAEPLWKKTGTISYSHQQKLEQVLNSTYQEIHKIPFQIILRLIMRKLIVSIGRSFYLLRKKISKS
ncbi:MAG: hypothetical protein ACOY3I_00650 [Verrucomicrobiota bacterium]